MSAVESKEGLRGRRGWSGGSNESGSRLCAGGAILRGGTVSSLSGTSLIDGFSCEFAAG